MRVLFDCELDYEERAILKELVEGLAYLGRAESWVDAQLLDADSEVDSDHPAIQWSQPAETASSKDRIRLLAPFDAVAFAQWREEAADVATRSAVAMAEKTASEKGKKLTPAAKIKTVATAAEPFPIDLIQALQNDTSNWQKQGWQRPPGSQWIDYELPTDLYLRQPLKLTPTKSKTTSKPFG